jgi:hypothetical protein
MELKAYDLLLEVLASKTPAELREELMAHKGTFKRWILKKEVLSD